MILHNTIFRFALALMIGTVLLVACANQPAHLSEARTLLAQGRGEEALDLLEKAKLTEKERKFLEKHNNQVSKGDAE